MHIQWYPGHMTKTKRMLKENISLVDVVIEILDARIPYSSKNPDIDILAQNKFRIVALNKSDLADDIITKEWAIYFEKLGFKVVIIDSVKGKGINDIALAAKELMREKIERQKARGRIFMPVRSMIVGIPNVGKSTLINKYVGRAITETGDRPGVTKSKQWVKIKKDFELLDTPGMLWPKFEDLEVGLKLSVTGAINDNILDEYTLSIELIKMILKIKPDALKARYKIDFSHLATPEYIHNKIGEARMFKIKGGETDKKRTSIILLDEFRSGKLGKLSLEAPDKY